MAFLERNSAIIEDDDITTGNDAYTLPATLRDDENNKEISLKNSIIISALLHPISVIVGWVIVFILGIMGINFLVFDRPEPKMQDIEFVLVDNAKEQTPINKNTKFRADKNTRAGGIHDPKRKVSMPSPSPRKASRPSGASAPKKSVQKQKTQTKHQNTVQSLFNKITQQAPEAPRAPRAGLAPKAGNVVPKAHPKSSVQIPVPSMKMPSVASPSGSPYSSGRNGTASSSGGTGKGVGAPSFSPSNSGSAGSSGRFSGSGSGGSGNYGNPGPGNPKGAPGIDAIREPDFGPYMRELQRRIKMNWEPPKGNESKRVVLLFSITRDGRLKSVRVHKSSGLAVADRAAVSAVELTAPFRPLPPEFRGSSVDIQFTFDYNVFGGSMY